MFPPESPSFALRIVECRARFDQGGGGAFRRWFGVGERPGYDESDTLPDSLRAEYRVLASRGRVVWGAIAQVNVGMFAEGPADLPGVSVYSPDPHFDANPQDLRAIGHACFQFKNTDPTDPEFKALAARLTDEYDQTVRTPLPRRLTDGREVYFGATMFHRSRLPGGVLRAGVFPIVIAPQATEANMVLPLPYWSARLQETWAALGARLDSAPTTSTAERVAAAAEKRPVDPHAVWWDVEKCPVLVTPAMFTAFRSFVKQHGVTVQAHLALEIRPDGTKAASIAMTYYAAREEQFDSNGVSVLIPRAQVDRFRGAIVDYQSTVFGTGIVVRLRGE